jgi:hypothetical protein
MHNQIPLVKPRVPIDPSTSTIIRPSSQTTPFLSNERQEFSELDASVQKGGSDKDMGRGKAFACSLCFKRGHTREYCMKFWYNRKFGPIYDNLNFGNVHYRKIALLVYRSLPG